MQGQPFSLHCTIPVEFAGKFPPDARALSGLGFDSVSVSKSAITIRKSQPGASGQPISRLEMALRRNSASLQLAAPAGCDVRIQGLRAAAAFLRVLSLFPSLKAGVPELASLLLPSLDAASSVAGTQYEALSKKCRDAQSDLSSLLARNRALLRSSEEGVLASLELERQSGALLARIKKLEGVSDDALLELVQEWLSSHRGAFNAAQFSRAHGVPPARAEEGLERLLASGEVHRVGGSLHVQSAHSHGAFEQGKKGALSRLKGALRLPKAGKG